jgi:hypothetical protein
VILFKIFLCFNLLINYVFCAAAPFTFTCSGSVPMPWRQSNLQPFIRAQLESASLFQHPSTTAHNTTLLLQKKIKLNANIHHHPSHRNHSTGSPACLCNFLGCFVHASQLLQFLGEGGQHGEEKWHRQRNNHQTCGLKSPMVCRWNHGENTSHHQKKCKRIPPWHKNVT